MAMLLMEKHLQERAKLDNLQARIKLLLSKYKPADESAIPALPPPKIRSAASYVDVLKIELLQ